MEVKHFAIVGAGLLSIAGFVGAASGADLPARTYTKSPAVVAPVYDWSGLYIGLNGGGASIRECWTVTSQHGYTWNNVLWYVKAGATVTDNKYNTSFTATGVVYNQASDTRWGAAVGTGIEFGFAPNGSVGVEYDHLFMGNPNVTFPAS